MKSYEVHYEVVGSGAGIIKEIIIAPSDYQARRIVEAKYRGQTVRILNTSEVRK